MIGFAVARFPPDLNPLNEAVLMELLVFFVPRTLPGKPIRPTEDETGASFINWRVVSSGKKLDEPSLLPRCMLALFFFPSPLSPSPSDEDDVAERGKILFLVLKSYFDAGVALLVDEDTVTLTILTVGGGRIVLVLPLEMMKIEASLVQVASSASTSIVVVCIVMVVFVVLEKSLPEFGKT